MSLTIAKLNTRLQIPRRLGVKPQLVERVARERLGGAVASRLAPGWRARTRVVRVRRLTLRLRLAPGKLNSEEALADEWAQALAQALFTALAYPAGAGSVEIVCAEDRTEWLARFIGDLATGAAADRWEYEEFRELLGLGAADAVINLLSAEPVEIAPVLLALERRGALDRALALFDELALERFFVAIGDALGATRSDLSIEDLLVVGRLLIAGQSHLAGGGLARRRQALRLFLAMAGDGETSATWAPRRVLHALIALAALLELARSSGPNEWEIALSAASIAGRFDHPLPAPVMELCEEIRQFIRQRSSASAEPAHFIAINQLSHLLGELRPLASSGGNQGESDQSRWVTSDCAGVFLLVGLLIRLGWPERILGSSLGAAYGPRALTYGLAGLGLALLGLAESPNRIDPGLALFAGWMDEPDSGGLRRFLAEGSMAERRELLTALAESAKARDQDLEKRTNDWGTTFDHLAEQLIREFAGRVRGFRRASRDFVTKNFLAVPGRICIEEKRIVAQLAPSPFHVALRISSADEPVEGVSWLGGRRLEIQLEGL